MGTPKNFWFYFNATPVIFSILFFSINLLILWSSYYEAPAFNDAVIPSLSPSPAAEYFPVPITLSIRSLSFLPFLL